jgi:hypothetical protein
MGSVPCLSSQKQRFPVAKWLGWSLLAVAIGLAMSHLLEMRTLWLDEAMLSLNYTARGWLGLLKPLSSYQVAPIGYLFLSKAAFHLLPGFIGLRLVSFGAYLASIFFLWRGLNWGNWASASGQTHSSPASLITATFAATPILMRYSHEVKQYMFDAMAWTVAFAALMGLLHGALQWKRRDHFLLLAMMGPALLSVSNTSVFVLAAWGATWLGHLLSQGLARDEAQKLLWRRTLVVFGIWGLSFLAYYAAFAFKHPAKNFMLTFWTAKDAFMPLSLHEMLGWLLMSFKGVTVFILQTTLSSWAMIAISLGLGWGAWSARRLLRSGWMPLFFLLPPALHLFASSLEMYPFHSRLAIWHVPGMMVLVGLAFAQTDPTKSRLIATSALSLLAITFLTLDRTDIAQKTDDFSRAIEFLDERPEATIIVHFSLGPGFAFHQQLTENLTDKAFQVIGDFKLKTLNEVAGVAAGLVSATDAYYLGPDAPTFPVYKAADDAFRAALQENGLGLEEIPSRDRTKLFHIVKQP